MRRSLRFRVLWLGVVGALVLVGNGGPVGGAQTGSPSAAPAADPTAHPVTINAGTCAQPAAQPAYEIGSTLPAGLDETAADQVVGGPVLTVRQTIATTLDDLLAESQPHAMLVHESPEQPATTIACGDIRGSVADGELVIELRPVGDSGFAGVAVLDRDDRGFLGLGEQETQVTVYLLSGLGAAATTPTAAATATAPAATAPAATAPAASSPAAGAADCPAGTQEPCLTIDLRDIYFAPNLITLPAETPVRVVLTNQGAILHNFSVTAHGNEGLANLGISVNVQPGQTETATVDAAAGLYYFFCDQPGHEAAGMRGYLDLKAGAAIETSEATVTPRAG